MASIADMLVAQVGQGSEQLGQNIGQGAALAMHVQQIQQQKEALAQKKEELNVLKHDKALSLIETGLTKVPKAAQKNFFSNFARNALGQMGINMSDDFIKGLSSPDINQGLLAQKMTEFRQAYRTALETKDFAEAQSIAAQMQQLFDGDVTKFAPVLNSAMNAESQSYSTAQGQKAAGDRQDKQIGATGPIEVAKKTANDYAKFQTEGGESAIDAKIEKLRGVIAALEKGKVKTGTFWKKVPGVNSDTMQAAFDEEFKSAADTVKSAINIKSILDSQFSDKAMIETQRQLGLDPAISTEKNKARMKALLNQLIKEKTAKIQEFKKQGYLSGAGGNSFSSLSPAAKKIVIKARMEETGQSEEDVMNELEGGE